MHIPYSRYAAIYDRTGQHRFGALLTERVLEWLRERNVTPSTALDLGTGTGAAALRLASHGVEVTGLDRSEAMLAAAREKAAVFNSAVRWVQGDMRTVEIDPSVDLITCFFDSINYLLEEDELRACFRSVYASLEPGGWFVFDVNPIHRYATDWNNSRDVAYADDSLICLFRSTYDPQTHRSPLVLTVFERVSESEDLWRRWEETHVERGYPLDLIMRLVEQAGFNVEEIRDLDEQIMQLGSTATEQSRRAVFFTRRPANGGKISS